MTATSPHLNKPVRSEREAQLEAENRQAWGDIGVLLAADDAICAFLLNCAPSDVGGEKEWCQQHRERSNRRRAAIANARAALSTTASRGGDDEQP